jgi:ABC-type branched-subunit amino acid transport system substrate-binding protein
VLVMCDWHVSPLTSLAAALRAAGLQQPIYSQALPHHPQLSEVSPSALEGVVLADFFRADAPNPQVKEFVRAFARFGGVPPNYLAANSWDTVQALAAGLRQAHSREALNRWLRSSGVTRPAFKGLSGPFALGRKLDARPVSLFEISGGVLRTL